MTEPKVSITCPDCGHIVRDVIPQDSCQWAYECPACHKILHPKTGDGCVIRSYGSGPVPPNLTGGGCCG